MSSNAIIHLHSLPAFLPKSYLCFLSAASKIAPIMPALNILGEGLPLCNLIVNGSYEFWSHILQLSMVMSSQQIQLLVTPARWRTSFRTSQLSITSMVLQWVTILHHPLGPGGFSARNWSTTCQHLVDGMIPYVTVQTITFFLAKWAWLNVIRWNGGLMNCRKTSTMESLVYRKDQQWQLYSFQW